MVTGLFGAVLGSTHPVAAVLVCAFAGALTSGSIITFCIATLPNHIFGVSIFSMTDIFSRIFILVIYWFLAKKSPQSILSQLFFSEYSHWFHHLIFPYWFCCIDLTDTRDYCSRGWWCNHFCGDHAAMHQIRNNCGNEYRWFNHDYGRHWFFHAQIANRLLGSYFFFGI